MQTYLPRFATRDCGQSAQIARIGRRLPIKPTNCGCAQSLDCEPLADLARQVSAAAAEPTDSLLQSAAVAASTELEIKLQGGMPMRTPAFVALSQTLPCFLANAWLALCRHPSELARLRAEPVLMPRAIEELLRYAGLARTLFRLATEDIDLGGIRIAEGERVRLMLASANRDPAQFPDPDRLDFTRRSAGQLALGAGRIPALELC